MSPVSKARLILWSEWRDVTTGIRVTRELSEMVGKTSLRTDESPRRGFETYVKSKDLDLWHVITDGDFPPFQNNPETKKDEVLPFHKQNDDLKKKLAKNNEAKMLKAPIGEDEEYCYAVKDSENLQGHEHLCGDPNHLIGECSKPPKNNDQRAFIGGAWSDNEEDEM
ncbi:hypothetical protein Tco_0475960 [Tanacetum coccineum]